MKNINSHLSHHKQDQDLHNTYSEQEAIIRTNKHHERIY
jgi:hypothetical protein